MTKERVSSFSMSLYIFSVRQQSDNAYLPPYSTQRPPEKPRPFQPAGINQQESAYSPSQNEVTNYPYQRPSSLYTPSNVPYSLSPNVDTSHGLSTPSTLYGSPTSLRPSSTYIPQDNYGSSPTFGSRPQSSTFPPFGGTTGPSNYPSAGTRPGTFPSSTPSTSQSSTYLPPQYSGFPSSGPRYTILSSSIFNGVARTRTIRSESLSYIS